MSKLDPIRKRVKEVAFFQGPSWYNSVTGVRITPPAPILTPLEQVTHSVPHQWYQAKRQGLSGKVDIGGGFYTRSFIWKPGFPDERLFRVSRSASNHLIDGHMRAIVVNGAEMNDLRSKVELVADSVMDSWGTTAVSKVIPTKSGVDLATTAAELVSGGLPKMIGASLLKSQLKDYRKAGDELLNAEFGIKPLISDLKDTAKAIVTAAERLQQLERDSGRLVRRKFTFPLREETFITLSSGTSAMPAGWEDSRVWANITGNRRETHQTFRTRRWFSGAFTYHLDLGERQRNQLYAAADNARLLLGIKLDAEVLWNLTPWSWLADWFGNMGDIATNVSHFSRDGLVMPYGYVMAETTATKWSRLSNLGWLGGEGPSVISDSLSFVQKQRRPANPFGFGLTDMVLDTRQISILGALGLTRMPSR